VRIVAHPSVVLAASHRWKRPTTMWCMRDVPMSEKLPRPLPAKVPKLARFARLKAPFGLGNCGSFAGLLTSQRMLKTYLSPNRKSFDKDNWVQRSPGNSKVLRPSVPEAQHAALNSFKSKPHIAHNA